MLEKRTAHAALGVAAVSVADVYRDDAGLYHPASEAELVALVRCAYRQGREVRVRGAAHSVSHAIYADTAEPFENVVGRRIPPKSEHFNLALDRYRGFRVVDEAQKLVEVDAGTHLGCDPNDPTATRSVSLLGKLAEHGWALSETGGITHQTVAGFTATGSSGGSVKYSVNDNLWGFRLIDGTGNIVVLTRRDEEFFSMAPSLGLMGVVSKITLKCVDDFAIAGRETTTTLDRCSIDLLGDGSAGHESLQRFLRGTDYARLEWWPQRGAERVLVWQARRLSPPPGFKPNPYRHFGHSPKAKQYAVSFIYTILGNLGRPRRANRRLQDDIAELTRSLKRDLSARLGRLGHPLAALVGVMLEAVVAVTVAALAPLMPLIRRWRPKLFPKLLSFFVPLDSARSGASRSFTDYAWHGLPMDNEASDVLLPTAFTELWLPLTETKRAMQVLHRYFSAAGDDQESYRRTGIYAWELYAAQPTEFWLSPSYTTFADEDEWRHGAFRVDPYWFRENADDPIEFYDGLWRHMRAAGIPFRLHWAKYQPVYSPYDPTWVDYFKHQYPRWDDFLRLREERDPNNIFLTEYWRDRLGLWGARRPERMPAAACTGDLWA
jgi:hypothetical protein